MKNNPAAGIARSIENALQQRRDAVLVKESIAGDAGAFAKLMSLYQNRKTGNKLLFLLVVFYLLILLPVSVLGSIVERRMRYAGFGS